MARLRTKLLVGLAVLCAILLWFAGCSDGYVYQREFSPDLLKYRSNNYYAIGFVQWGNQEYSNPLLDRIRQYEDQCIPPQSPPRWVFVDGRKKGVRGMIGGAKNVDRALRPYEEWLDWSDKRPQLANRVWPEVINLIRQEEFFKMRVLLMAAKDATTVASFEKKYAEFVEQLD